MPDSQGMIPGTQPLPASQGMIEETQPLPASQGMMEETQPLPASQGLTPESPSPSMTQEEELRQDIAFRATMDSQTPAPHLLCTRQRPLAPTLADRLFPDDHVVAAPDGGVPAQSVPAQDDGGDAQHVPAPDDGEDGQPPLVWSDDGEDGQPPGDGVVGAVCVSCWGSS